MELRRWLPLSGIVFVALVILGVVLLAGDHPESDASGAELLAFYASQNGRQALAAFALAASAPFIVFFALSFADRLWPGSDRRPLWERVLVSGSIVTAMATIAGGWIHFSLADGGDQGIAPEAMQALATLDSSVWLPVTCGLGVLMLGAAGSILASRTLPRVLGWGALVLGVGLFFLFVDFIALILTLVWILIVSVMLFRRTTSVVREAAA